MGIKNIVIADLILVKLFFSLNMETNLFYNQTKQEDIFVILINILCLIENDNHLRILMKQ